MLRYSWWSLSLIIKKSEFQTGLFWLCRHCNIATTMMFLPPSGTSRPVLHTHYSVNKRLDTFIELRSLLFGFFSWTILLWWLNSIRKVCITQKNTRGLILRPETILHALPFGGPFQQITRIATEGNSLSFPKLLTVNEAVSQCFERWAGSATLK